MLVLSTQKDENGQYHVINQWEKRMRQSKELLLQILADCNLYLPSDWRMTGPPADWQIEREVANEFRIYVRLPELNSAGVFVGNSYRTSKTDILHVIDTVLFPHWPNVKLFKEYQEANDLDWIHIDQTTKDALPEMLTPNLYYFMPCPEDSPSPLFARQYERVKYQDHKKIGAQYHRIHALTRQGVDSDHFRWVFWNTDGDVRPVPFPADDFHGKSYWGIPTLKQAPRVSNEQVYKQKYVDLLTEHNIAVAEPEHRPYSNYESEFKFCCQDVKSTAFSQLRQHVLDVLGKHSISISKGSTRQHEDLYLDDEDMNLLKNGASFRLRKQQDNVRITLKKRFPGETEGIYRRIEEEVVISSRQERDLLDGKPISPLPYRLLAYVAPGCGKLTQTARIMTRRDLYEVSDRLHRRAELCFDEVTYIDGTRQEGPFYEIELESKGMPIDTLAETAQYIENSLKLQRSSKSKYERAHEVLRGE